MTFVICWTIFRQSKIWKLCIVILYREQKKKRRIWDISCQVDGTEKYRKPLTESRSTLDVLKSRYMTFAMSLCRKASPFAAPRAIFMRRFQESGWKYELPVSEKNDLLDHIVQQYWTVESFKERHCINSSRTGTDVNHKKHTSKEMILQAPSRHEFIHKKPLFILQAVSNELYKMRMR